MGAGRDLVARRKDGTTFPVEIGLSFADTDAGRLVIAFISDITERKRAERRLRTQFAITQVTAEGLALADAVPRLLGAVCECLGWDLGELWRVDPGANVLRWEGCWHSPGLECAAFTALSRELTFAPGSGIPGGAWASGQPVWAPDVTEEVCFHRAAEARRVGLRGACAFPIRSRDRVTAVAVFFSRELRRLDADLLDLVGDVATRIGLYIEYRRVQEETERQREVLHQQEKLAALGTLSAGLAHEINNPIGIIASRVECMLLEAEEQRLSETVRGDLQVIAKHADRVARITQGLLSLSRQQAWRLVPLDLNSVVEEALILAEKQLAREGVVLERDLAPWLPAVLGSPNHLEQVILNLLTNAREAMPEGGRLRVATRRDGPSVEVEVTDTGRGIPAEHLSRIFDPFFTTKEKGTGLGLAISYGIVREHGGTLAVRSREGAGTTFLVTIPAAAPR
jgi:signal transduction histidine kinase